MQVKYFIPKNKEALRFGIQPDEYRKYDSLIASLIHPFFSDRALKKYYR